MFRKNLFFDFVLFVSVLAAGFFLGKPQAVFASSSEPSNWENGYYYPPSCSPPPNSYVEYGSGTATNPLRTIVVYNGWKTKSSLAQMQIFVALGSLSNPVENSIVITDMEFTEYSWSEEDCDFELETSDNHSSEDYQMTEVVSGFVIEKGINSQGMYKYKVTGWADQVSYNSFSYSGKSGQRYLLSSGMLEQEWSYEDYDNRRVGHTSLYEYLDGSLHRITRTSWDYCAVEDPKITVSEYPTEADYYQAEAEAEEEGFEEGSSSSSGG